MCNIVKINKTKQEINVEKICMKLAPLESDIIFLSGSLIEAQIGRYSKGMGNRHSDIDVFVITENIEYYQDVVYNDKSCKTTFFSMDGNSFDVEIYEYSEVMQFFNLLRKIDFNKKSTDNIRTINLFTLEKAVLKKYMSFTHRLLNSIPIYNSDKYEIVKNSICKKNYFVYNTRIYINFIDLHYEDIIGYIEEKQGILAVCMGQKLLIYAIGAYLFSKGISFDREKWIPLLLENLSMEDDEVRVVFDKFRRYYFSNQIEQDDECIKNTKKMLMWINELVDNL